jgi:protocatechuate 3,4-dioxygenase beta subunit
MRSPFTCVALLVLVLAARPLHAAPCPWCGAGDAPAGLTSTMRLAPPSEPGVRLEISGVVYQRDGKTPAPDVLLYAWQANARGVYPTRGDEKPGTITHGYLRGWLRTGAHGRYEITTIRPGAVSGGSAPAHINMTATPPGGRESLVNEIMFDDDVLVTAAYRAGLRTAGGSGLVHPFTDARGVQHAVRDIVLER